MKKMEYYFNIEMIIILEAFQVELLSLEKIYQGNIVAEGIESKEVSFFDIDNLPQEINPANIPNLQELKNKRATYFND